MARPKGTKNKQPSKKRNQVVIANHLIDKKRALAFFRGVNQSTILSLPRRTIGGLRDQVLKVKRCNCKRSSCLKLYCECFASGILCAKGCCCVDCRNLDFEAEKVAEKKTTNDASTSYKDVHASSSARQNELEERYPDKKINMRLQSLVSILERNTHAFRPRAVNIVNSSSSVMSQTLSQNVRSATAAASMAANSSSSNYASTSAAIMEKLRQDNKHKKSKIGCNCRKSFCLKKYCECFQALIYCNAESCRCADCQNRPGNAKREKLVDKTRKKEEDKDNLTLAALKLDRAKLSAVDSNVVNANVYSVGAYNQKIGGVPENIAAMVTAGVAAAGVDLFLPASSYTQSMKMKNGNVVSEVAFGMVGKQVVGGSGLKEESNEVIAPITVTSDGLDSEGSRGSTIPFGFDHDDNETESEKQKRLVFEEAMNYFDSLRVLLNINRTSTIAQSSERQDGSSGSNNIQGRGWGDFIQDLNEQNIIASMKKIDHGESERKTKPKGTVVLESDASKPFELKSKYNKLEPNSQPRKRSHEEYARKSIVEMSKFVSRFRNAIDNAGKCAEMQFDDIVSELKSSGKNDGWLEDLNSNVLHQNKEMHDRIGALSSQRQNCSLSSSSQEKDSQKVPTSSNSQEENDNQSDANDTGALEDLVCSEELAYKSTPKGSDESSENEERLTGVAIKELYILAAQDTALLHELAAMIREKALSLARKRRIYEIGSAYL